MEEEIEEGEKGRKEGGKKGGKKGRKERQAGRNVHNAVLFPDGLVLVLKVFVHHRHADGIEPGVQERAVVT